MMSEKLKVKSEKAKIFVVVTFVPACLATKV